MEEELKAGLEGAKGVKGINNAVMELRNVRPAVLSRMKQVAS
jgi:hypothetical protein